MSKSKRIQEWLKSIKGIELPNGWRLNASAFLLIIVFSVILRCLPYIVNDYKFEVGFDTGLYEYILGKYTSSVIYPNLPATPHHASYEVIQYKFMEPGFFIISSFTVRFMNLSISEVFRWWLPSITSIIFLFIIYVAAKTITDDKKVPIISCFLYAVSYVQYNAIDESYYKQIFANMILFVSLIQIDRFYKSGNNKYLYIVTILGASLVSFSRPILLLFALVYMIYLVESLVKKRYRRTRSLLLSIVAMMLISSVVWIPTYGLEMTILTDVMQKSFQSGTPGGAVPHRLRDSESILWAYFVDSPLVVIFGVIGLLVLHSRKRWLSFSVTFYILLFLMAAKLVFYNRFILNLDLIVIIFSAYGIVWMAEQLRNNILKTLLITLIILTILPGQLIFQYDKAPYIHNNEESIDWIIQNIDEDGSILFAPDTRATILKAKGYRVAIYDDTLENDYIMAYIINELFLLEGHKNLTIINEFNLTGLDVYVLWGSWEEVWPLPHTGKMIPSKEWESSKYFEKIYNGYAEISVIYKLMTN